VNPDCPKHGDDLSEPSDHSNYNERGSCSRIDADARDNEMSALAAEYEARSIYGDAQ
jgi:hypothetical protein